MILFLTSIKCPLDFPQISQFSTSSNSLLRLQGTEVGALRRHGAASLALAFRYRQVGYLDGRTGGGPHRNRREGTRKPPTVLGHVPKDLLDVGNVELECKSKRSSLQSRRLMQNSAPKSPDHQRLGCTIVTNSIKVTSNLSRCNDQRYTLIHSQSLRSSAPRAKMMFCRTSI